MAEGLALQVAVNRYVGGWWTNLEDEVNGLSLGAESLAERAFTRRTQTADGIWIDGSFGVRSTTESVLETLEIYIDGHGSNYLYRQRRDAIKALFDQMRYQVRVDVGDSRETWDCVVPGEYTERTEQAFQFATIGLLKVQVARLPKVTLEELV